MKGSIDDVREEGTKECRICPSKSKEVIHEKEIVDREDQRSPLTKEL